MLQSTPSDSIIATRRSSQSFAGMSTDDDLQLSSGSVPAGGRNGRANMSGSSSVSTYYKNAEEYGPWLLPLLKLPLLIIKTDTFKRSAVADFQHQFLACPQDLDRI